MCALIYIYVYTYIVRERNPAHLRSRTCTRAIYIYHIRASHRANRSIYSYTRGRASRVRYRSLLLSDWLGIYIHLSFRTDTYIYLNTAMMAAEDPDVIDSSFGFCENCYIPRGTTNDTMIGGCAVAAAFIRVYIRICV